MRNNNALAAAIAGGFVRFNHDTPCTTQGCDNPLLAPVAFNQTSKLDDQPVCSACDAWESVHRTKCPA